MEEHLQTQPTAEPAVEEASVEYLGQWNRLVSTTNWEKGRIICRWRETLIAARAPAGEQTDEAWSRRVGNVSPQHVGRLRRVFERFAATHEQYAGLYWSHFQAAVDWPDAEMYLEGAVQSGWSVAQMRAQRWEAVGGAADQSPSEEEIIAAEWDEDVDASGDEEVVPPEISSSPAEVQPADTGAEEQSVPVTDETPPSADPDSPAAESAAEPVRPFEDLGPLPADLDEAFEAFKLAVLHHKLSGWQEISRDDVLAVLDALKQLALVPAEH